jgi:hypothetical protein
MVEKLKLFFVGKKSSALIREIFKQVKNELTAKSAGDIQLSPKTTPPRVSFREPAWIHLAMSTPIMAASLPP